MVRIKGIAGEMSETYRSPSTRRRQPQAAGSGESGFVLILVLPVAMLLLMTALSLVSRSNSAAVASAQESRAQAARMAAEFGLNQLMALVNTPNGRATLQDRVNREEEIEGSPTTSYTITAFNPPDQPPQQPATPRNCSTSDSDNDNLNVTIVGRLTVNSSTTYTQEITRTLRVCVPTGDADQLRVRAIR